MSRRQKPLEAIKYARRHLTPSIDKCLDDIQSVMGCLAIGPDTSCSRYQTIYSRDRWHDLARSFHSSFCKLHSLPLLSLLEMTLNVGLSAIKTPFCESEESQNSNCPTCSPPFKALASSLPSCRHTRSLLVCRYSGQIMDDAGNSPIVLPNGHVYSSKAVQEITEINGGVVVCPQTGARYEPSELQKAYIV